MAKSRIAIIGAGSWGLALANVFASILENEVCVWAHKQSTYDDLVSHYESKTYLKGIKLNEAISFKLDLKEAVFCADIIIMATPSFALEDTAVNLAECDVKPRAILIATKGIDSQRMLTMSSIARKHIKGVPILTLSGPSHAEEVATLIPTAIVVAGRPKDKHIVNQVRDSLTVSPYLRIYGSTDQKGVEVSGALKNIYAIASGIVSGLGMGDNTKAALITRSLKEMQRFAMHKQAKESTLYGLSGVGDLVVTCMSPLSRNFRLGQRLAKGEKYEDIKSTMEQVAEGVYACQSVYKYSSKYKISMPIARSVYKVIFESYDCEKMLYELMSRKAKNEDS